MDQLTLILNTLNRLEVRGSENLTRLLGCIQALEKMKEGHDNGDQNEQGKGT